MRWMKRNTRTPIGIHVDGGFIAAAQLTCKEGAWHIDAATMLQRAPGAAERVGNKPVGSEVWHVQVAARHSDSADIKLTFDAERHGLEAAVKQIDLRVSDGLANGHSAWPRLGSRSIVDTTTDHRFSWTIFIDKPRSGCVRAPEVKTLFEKRFAANNEGSCPSLGVVGRNRLAQEIEMSGGQLNKTQVCIFE